MTTAAATGTSNVLSHSTANANTQHANQKNETNLTQRQRLRKAGPFAVDSQSIPDSRIKYAGAWPPPSYESDSENNNYFTAQQTGTKPVRFSQNHTVF